MARLDEFDKDEWRDIQRRLRPDMSEAQHEAAWRRFQEMKRRRKMQ